MATLCKQIVLGMSYETCTNISVLVLTSSSMSPAAADDEDRIAIAALLDDLRAKGPSAINESFFLETLTNIFLLHTVAVHLVTNF